MKVKIDGLFEPTKLVDPFTWKDSMEKGTIVHYCIDNDKMALLKKVLENEPKLNALLDQKLINVTNQYNQTPLQTAILEKKHAFVKLLIENKCQQLIPDIEGKTAYHYALMSQYDKYEFEKLSPFILCAYGKEKILVVVANCVTNDTIKEINSKLKEYKLKKVKIYMNSSNYTDEVKATLFVGERSSMGKNARFISYL